MKQFEILRFLFIMIHYSPVIGIVYIPKEENREGDYHELGFYFIFFTIEFRIFSKEKRKRQLIEATISDNMTVLVKEDNFNTYYPYRPEKDINDLSLIYRRESDGNYVPARTFAYNKKMDRYIIQYSNGGVFHTRTGLFRPDEVKWFLEGQQVKGYLRKGKFIVVS